MSTFCNCDKKHDYYDHGKKKKTDCRAILECGREFFRTLPTSDFDALDPTTGDVPIPLAEVTIDTRKLYKPCVKIEYSSLINTVLNVSDASPSLTLVFRLVRKCKGEDEEELRTWTYERSITALDSLTTEDTFTVTFCECFDRGCCDEKTGKCCTYTLQLVQAEFDFNATFTLDEKNISAIAACSSCI